MIIERFMRSSPLKLLAETRIGMVTVKECQLVEQPFGVDLENCVALS